MMAFAQRGLPLRLVTDWLALCDLTGRGPSSLSRWSGRQKALETVSQRLDPFHSSNDHRQGSGLYGNEILSTLSESEHWLGPHLLHLAGYCCDCVTARPRYNVTIRVIWELGTPSGYPIVQPAFLSIEYDKQTFSRCGACQYSWPHSGSFTDKHAR